MVYLAFGVAGEPGEFANQFKKIFRDDKGVITPERRAKLLSEMGDALWYFAVMAHELKSSLEEVCTANIKKLADRQARGTIKGSGDNR